MKLICVEGINGCGKTTLINRFKREFGGGKNIFYYELPYDMEGYREGWLSVGDHYAWCRRHEDFLNVLIERHGDTDDVLICSRSILSVMVYDAKSILLSGVSYVERRVLEKHCLKFLINDAIFHSDPNKLFNATPAHLSRVVQHIYDQCQLGEVADKIPTDYIIMQAPESGIETSPLQEVMCQIYEELAGIKGVVMLNREDAYERLKGLALV